MEHCSNYTAYTYVRTYDCIIRCETHSKLSVVSGDVDTVSESVGEVVEIASEGRGRHLQWLSGKWLDDLVVERPKS